jgi:endonuclease/exonuclease/phosphatase family metal-dependent hydrolase
MSFSVLTLNLWNISEPLATRYRALAAGLKRLRPDILCLQEADRDPASGEPQVKLVADMCGLANLADAGELAIASTGPIAHSTSAALPEFAGDFPRRALTVETLIGGRPVRITNTHLAYRPEMTAEREVQTKALLSAISEGRPAADASPHVLSGDFNDTPDSLAVRAVLNNPEGFQDGFAVCHRDRPGFTYARRNKYVDAAWTLDQRIDYVFASRGLVVESCSVVFDGEDGFDLASDHFGVFCRLEFR